MSTRKFIPNSNLKYRVQTIKSTLQEWRKVGPFFQNENEDKHYKFLGAFTAVNSVVKLYSGDNTVGKVASC